MNRFASLTAAAVLVFCGAGCEIEKAIQKLEEGGNSAMYQPTYVISIHEIVEYPKADLLERSIETYDGSTIYVNVNQLLHSKNIKKIERIERKENGFYDLRLTLDRRGFLLWSSFSYRTRGRKLACVIDGLCYRKFVPSKPTAEHEDEFKDHLVIMEGPFDEATSANLAKYSEKNYSHYNP